MEPHEAHSSGPRWTQIFCPHLEPGLKCQLSLKWWKDWQKICSDQKWVSSFQIRHWYSTLHSICFFQWAPRFEWKPPPEVLPPLAVLSQPQAIPQPTLADIYWPYDDLKNELLTTTNDSQQPTLAYEAI